MSVRVLRFCLLVLLALCWHPSSRAADTIIPAPDTIVTLEMRPRPETKPTNPPLPASVLFKVRRDRVADLPAPDADGIYRRTGFLFAFADDPQTTVMVRFAVRGPIDRELAALTPVPDASPAIPEFRVYENIDSPTTPLLGLDDPEFGAVIAFCTAIGKAPPHLCEFDTAMEPGLIVGTMVKAPDFPSWRKLVRLSRERVRPLMQRSP